MSESSKKTGMLGQIFMAVVIALLAGGTAPWWWEELTGKKTEERPAAMEIGEMSRDSLAARQKDMEAELRRMREQLQTASKSEPQSRAFDISGTWRSAQGLSYLLQQSGNTLTIQEVNPMFGVTAVGQGTMNDRNVEISYTTAAYTNGRALLKLSPDGNRLTGTFTDLVSGLQVRADLTR